MRLVIKHVVSEGAVVVSAIEGREIVNRFRLANSKIGGVSILTSKDHSSIEINIDPVAFTEGIFPSGRPS